MNEEITYYLHQGGFDAIIQYWSRIESRYSVEDEQTFMDYSLADSLALRLSLRVVMGLRSMLSPVSSMLYRSASIIFCFSSSSAISCSRRNTCDDKTRRRETERGFLTLDKPSLHCVVIFHPFLFRISKN